MIAPEWIIDIMFCACPHCVSSPIQLSFSHAKVPGARHFVHLQARFLGDLGIPHPATTIVSATKSHRSPRLNVPFCSTGARCQFFPMCSARLPTAKEMPGKSDLAKWIAYPGKPIGRDEAEGKSVPVRRPAFPVIGPRPRRITYTPVQYCSTLQVARRTKRRLQAGRYLATPCALIR